MGKQLVAGAIVSAIVCAIAHALGGCDSLSGLSANETAPPDGGTTSDSGNSSDAGGPTPGADAGDAGAVLGTAYRAEVIADKPLAYFRFEDGPDAKTAKDEMGAHDGTYPIAPSFVDTGVAGSHAFHIVKDSLSHVRVPGAAFGFPNLSPMAIEAWVRPSTYVDYEMLASNEPPASPRRGWSLFLRTPGRAELDWFEGPPDAGTDRLAKYGATFVEDTGALPTGKWLHVVFEYDGVGTRFYVDGAFVHNESSSYASADPGSDVLLGCRASGTGGVRDCIADGDLDEVAIYDHPLGDIRVKVHYEKGKP